MQDFNQGQPIGTHFKYHPNGKESYKVQYKNGKKQGKEQFFASNGKLLGEGEYKEGTPFGKHYRNAENGTQVYLAQFDGEGKLLLPVQEFNPAGKKIAEYLFVGDKRHGAFRQWYEDGTPNVEYNYDNGQFEGEQKEYYPNGQLKVKTVYHNNLKDGLFEEWYENGQSAAHIELKRERRTDFVRNGTKLENRSSMNST